MAYEAKFNTGAFFKNEKKEGKQPDYRGNINVGGKMMDIAGWVTTSQGGKKYISLKIQEPFKKDGDTPIPPAPTPKDADGNDLPF